MVRLETKLIGVRHKIIRNTIKNNVSKYDSCYVFVNAYSGVVYLIWTITDLFVHGR